MKITIIGSKGKYNAEYFFIKAFKRLGYEVNFIDQYEGIRRKTLIRLLSTRLSILRKFLHNIRINKIIRNTDLGNSDIILVFKGELLTESSLKILSNYNVYLFYPDTFRFRLILKDRLQYFNGVIVTTLHKTFYEKLGAKRVISIWWACDPEVHRKLNEEKIYDVSFVGTFYPNRWLILSKVKRKPHIFGNFWYLKAGYHHPPVYGEDYIKIINQTKINLNIHHPSDLKAEAPNMRVFEVAGSSGFILTERMSILRNIFKNIETYSDLAEFNEKIEYYVNDDKVREEIGYSLRQQCIDKHTYIHRAERILKEI
ncbi:MAG: glycosyltransferase [Saccharolobus sp.]|uniref:CgeB family protein n=1 Tax=Saccharolobus TaxID=2100760 RepID=UPI001F0F4F9F|nr:glycosyltransferase [Saccharolobus shibatae]MCH4816758.1 glycosyltransferase [Saccharolobus shibatae]